jgi:hypothetical protein
VKPGLDRYVFSSYPATPAVGRISEDYFAETFAMTLAMTVLYLEALAAALALVLFRHRRVVRLRRRQRMGCQPFQDEESLTVKT